MRIDKYKALKTFIEMHKNSMLSETTAKGKITYEYCSDNPELWWNYALIDHVISNNELKEIEKYFVSKNRQPSIYFSDDEKNMPLEKILQKEGYNITSKDVWLFWDKPTPELKDSDIIEIKNNEDFEKWIKTYIKSYPEDDPKNPYGEQTGFAKVLRKSWYAQNNSKDKYYLLYDEGNPVATAILTNCNKMGYISSVGSIPSVRGKGFGKKISLHCVKESFKQRNKRHFLITEKGDHPYDFYQRIGFKPKFSSCLFTKSE